MKPDDAEMGVTIDFAKGEASPRRVFGSLITILEGFEALDRLMVSALDPRIVPLMVLEDIEAASITAWVRTRLRQVDDEVLKSGDWKKGVGAVLVKGKHRTLEYLDTREAADEGKRLMQLRDDLEKLLESAPVRHLPQPLPITLQDLVKPLDQIQAGKAALSANDRLLLTTEAGVYEANVAETKRPSEYLTAAEGSKASGVMPMQLLVRRPDYLGEAKWDFRHGRDTVTAAILDEVWLQRFKAGAVPIVPGSALACMVRYAYEYDQGGRLTSAQHDVVEVQRVIPPTDGSSEGFPFTGEVE
ncbi:hypothetical protein [Methylobacterium sp. WL120]|uniref:hypothetical protein n=1 Tax=Methylobacterium sp. WL120 TaxID=2603887 RepID=UPI0011C7E8E8|nr:hypothetical protein [Methylobacterium sp. WL120]TXM59232.1 hypothetical protein FV229_25015 [Methylobacterium sp. WL120]